MHINFLIKETRKISLVRVVTGRSFVNSKNRKWNISFAITEAVIDLR